jgi:hypothetical protein
MPKPDSEAIRTFLSWWSAEGPWQLVSIDPEQKGNLVGRSFEDLEEAVEFAVEKNQRCNLYYTLNSLLRDVNSKPTRKDISSMDWLHVDVDPRVGEDLKSEQKRIIGFLRQFEPRPSALIFSGGGYQALWRLAEPIEIKGRQSAYDDAKRYNKQLEILFDADSCHNVDRLMRLPGTVNWPDEKKRKKGREPALSEIVWASQDVHELGGVFTKAPDVQSDARLPTDGTVEISGNVERLDSTDGLGLPSLCRGVIANGEDPDDPDRFDGDRSAAVFYVACEMVRCGVPDETIFAILTDPDWAISAHVLDQGRPEDYAIRQIERAKEHAVDEDLCALNDEFAVVGGSQVRILQQWRNEQRGETEFRFLTKSDFVLLLSGRYREIDIGDGKTKDIPLAMWWLNHPQHRVYGGVTFDPNRASKGVLNLWQGFACEAIPGDVDLFLEHIKENLCNGDEERYNYLVGWMANTVQNPGEPGQVAVVLRGKQGTGKGVFAHHFGALFGRNYLPVRDSSHIFGQFNGHLRECVFLFADESFWVESTKQKSLLKNLITEPEFMMEQKGRDATRAHNCVHLVMASNEQWVVPVEGLDRRFFVLDVSDAKLRDGEYFGRIVEQMENGGHEALLHYLLNYDLSDFDVRKFPATEAHSDQMQLTLRGFDAWWFEKLRDGRLLSDSDDAESWPSWVFKSELQHDYLTNAVTWNATERATQVALAKRLSAVLPGGLESGKLRGRHTVRTMRGDVIQQTGPLIYKIPSLKACRDKWDSERGAYAWTDHEHIEEDDDTQEVRGRPF